MEIEAVRHADDLRPRTATNPEDCGAAPFDADRSHETRLGIALANYLRDSQNGNKGEVRCAIREWRHDSAHRGLHPEQLLVQFKGTLAIVLKGQQPADYERLLANRRDLIVICIEEYFSGV